MLDLISNFNYKNLLIIALLGFELSAHADVNNTCKFPNDPQIIEETVSQTHLLWEFKDFPVLWSKKLPRTEEFQVFRNSIASTMNTDPRVISDLQYPIFKNSNDINMIKEGRNIRLVLDQNIGKIEPIRCLEALLVDQQTKRLPLIDFPNEFIASILYKFIDGEKFLKIYLSLSDTQFQKPRIDLIQQDIESRGWNFLTSIHNHPFYIEKYPTDLFQGGIVPSINDVQLGRNLVADKKLEFLSVTNGFHTIWLNPLEMMLLNTP